MSIENRSVIRLVRQDPRCKDGIWGEIKVPDLENDNSRAVVSYDTLENPWLENIPFKSCIPLGTYKLRKKTTGRYAKAYKNRWGHPFVIHIAGIEGRTNVLIHTGNHLGHTTGCVLIGRKHSHRKGEGKTIAASRATYAEFFARVQEIWALTGGITLEISNKEG